jgi:hypothetical protein
MYNITHFEQITNVTPFVCREPTTWSRSEPLAMYFHYNWWSNLSGHMRVEVIKAPINLMLNFYAAHCYAGTYLPIYTASCPGNTIIFQGTRWKQHITPLATEQLTPTKSDFSSWLILPVAFFCSHRRESNGKPHHFLYKLLYFPLPSRPTCYIMIHRGRSLTPSPTNDSHK